MKRQLAYWVALCLFFVRCQSSGSAELGAKPDNLVDEDKMVAILTDVHLAEARVAKMVIPSTDTSTLLFKRLQAQAFKKYNVDTASYSKSFMYYSSRPAKLAKIYEEVVAKLKTIEKEKSAKTANKRPVPQ